ncbi:mannose-6-phosphate isomerase, class I [Streptomyces sp. NPDC058052]|uniref:mannose-6-phosphate isomerase, class I n=1 Tax=Streptomyces sp. NPDC058052 TaxID=3346316 RepID=UPI0036F12C65
MDPLLNTVQPYAWGSTTLLPALRGVPPTGAPQAEVWMGAHPAAPSRIRRGGDVVPLDRVVAGDPEGELGAGVLRRFGARLPFLLKLLAADAPLSLQVHPDLAQAQAGYAREDALGIPADAPHRTYRDDQHKPEMIVALTEFRGLCGFRDPGECAGLLDSLGVPALRPHAATLRTGSGSGTGAEALAAVFGAFLRPPAGLLDAVVAALGTPGGPYATDLAAYRDVARAHPGDAGVLAALLLRYVELAPGQALFLGAGIPHAYLSGLGVEIMAGSDNVLRCGLTGKHVDVDELLRVVRFAAPPARIVTPCPGPGGEEVYPAPVDDFRLSRLRPHPGLPPFPLALDAPQIVLCTEGRVEVRTGGGTSGGATVVLGPGDSGYLPAGADAVLGGEGTAFRATVGIARGRVTLTP